MLVYSEESDQELLYVVENITLNISFFVEKFAELLRGIINYVALLPVSN